MLKRTLRITAGLLLLLSNRGLAAQNAQAPAQMPTQFEIYYESGLGDRGTRRVQAGNFDAFDSAKRERVYDATGGQSRYQAELSAGERKKIYDAILQNNLPAIKADFITTYLEYPYMVGRLRMNIDGRISEIQFDRTYIGGIPDDNEWTRLRNVLDVIENILKAKDQLQKLPRHKLYE